MWAVAFVVVILVVVAVVVVVVRRPRRGDIPSVKDYHQALGTLEHLSERIGPHAVRPVRVVPVGRPDNSPGRTVPPVPVRGTDEFPDPDGPIVFDEARPVERGRPGGIDPVAPARTERAQRMALDSMNRRNRPGTGFMVVVAAVIVFGVLVVVGSQRSHNTSHSTSTTVASGRHTTASTSKSTAKPAPTRKPTPTTEPDRFVATTTASGGTSATYAIPHTGYRITLTGTGACWVQVDAATSGATVWAGELSAGTVQNVEATGATTVRFGTPTLSLQVDSVPVVLPSPVRTPFVATFSPAPGATAGTVPSSTTTAPTSTTAPASG